MSKLQHLHGQHCSPRQHATPATSACLASCLLPACRQAAQHTSLLTCQGAQLSMGECTCTASLLRESHQLQQHSNSVALLQHHTMVFAQKPLVVTARSTTARRRVQPKDAAGMHCQLLRALLTKMMPFALCRPSGLPSLCACSASHASQAGHIHSRHTALLPSCN